MRACLRVLYDVSMPVTRETAEWPGDQPFSCGWTMERARGESVNVGWVKTSPHVGTHVDAPYHVLDDGARVGGLALDAFVGACVVLDATGRHELDARFFEPRTLAPRVLVRTQARSDPTSFRREFPVLTEDAVSLLASRGVRLVGLDAPSFDRWDAKELRIHAALARQGIVNVENLVLDGIAPGAYELLAAPVRWADMDAAPIRALLRR